MMKIEGSRSSEFPSALFGFVVEFFFLANEKTAGEYPAVRGVASEA